MDKVRCITSAYNRSYKSAEEMLQDWQMGKDFKIIEGPYLSIRDAPLLKEQGVTHLAFFHKEMSAIHHILKL